MRFSRKQGVGLVAAVLMLAAGAAHAAPTPVFFRVIASDKAVGDKFSQRIESAIKAEGGYEIRQVAPTFEVIVFVNQDVNDRKNPTGYSIAIAHVSNLFGYYIASKLLDSKQSDALSVREQLIKMIREPGQMEYLNVAHMDEATDDQISELSSSITSTFFSKVPGNAGR
jgi:hypothetical protein